MSGDETKRGPRALLRSAALTAGSMIVGCGSAAGNDPEPLPLPGNPKGAIYDDDQTEGTEGTEGAEGAEGTEGDTEGPEAPEGTEGTEGAEGAEGAGDGTEDGTEGDTTEAPDGVPLPPPRMEPQPRMEPLPLPANPKGSLYDDRLYDPDFDPLADDGEADDGESDRS